MASSRVVIAYCQARRPTHQPWSESLVVLEGADVLGRQGPAESHEGKPGARIHGHLNLAALAQAATDELSHGLTERSRRVARDGQCLPVEVIGRSIVVRMHAS